MCGLHVVCVCQVRVWGVMCGLYICRFLVLGVTRVVCEGG